MKSCKTMKKEHEMKKETTEPMPAPAAEPAAK
jgi:hypothetical protein